MPIAISPETETWRITLSRLKGFRNLGSSAANAATSSTRNTNAA